MCKCIYCNSPDNLTLSDIIPYALTGAKLTRKFVCETHNGFTNDNFEKFVIQNLNFFRNSLGLSERSGGEIKYKADLTIAGHKISNTNISDRASIYEDKKRLFKVEENGKQSFIGNVEVLRKKKGVDEKDIEILDTKDMVVSTSISLEETFASEKMLLTIAKIAYEWYCYKHNINEFVAEKYQSIVDCILMKNDIIDYVQIVIDGNLYITLDNIASYGTHTLFEYVDKNGDLYVVISFWNIVVYKVKICSGNIQNTSIANTYEALMYNIDETKGEITFGTYGACNFLSMPARESIKKYHKAFLSRTENLLKTLVLSYPTVATLTKRLEKAFTKYEQSNNFAQLVDYESNKRITIIRLLELLFENSKSYDKEKSFNENLHTLYKQEFVVVDIEDNQEYLRHLLSLHENSTLLECMKKWLDNFKQISE